MYTKQHKMYICGSDGNRFLSLSYSMKTRNTIVGGDRHTEQEPVE